MINVAGRTYPNYIVVYYWLHLNCAALGVKDFSFIEGLKPVGDWKLCEERNADLYREECSRLYKLLRDELLKVMCL